MAVAEGDETTAVQTEAAYALTDEEFRIRLAELEAFGNSGIGFVGGGPSEPDPDVMCARRLVAVATAAQLEQLLRSPNAAVRANAAREIILGRESELALLRLVANDTALINMRIVELGDWDQVVRDETRSVTVAAIVEGALAYTGRSLPP